MDTTAFWIALAGALLAAGLVVFALLVLLRVIRLNGNGAPPPAASSPPPPVAAPAPAPEPTPPRSPELEPAPAQDPEREEAYARAQQEARRARQLAALAVTLDLEALLAQVLEAAAATARADAAALRLLQEKDAPLVKTLNIHPGEEAPSLDTLSGETRARAVAMRYRYLSADVPAHTDPIRSGLVVPLLGEDGEAIGTLGVYWRSEGHDPADSELAALEELAGNSGRAIENARRFKKMRELAVLDSLTGLYNRTHFYETLGREVKRAHRYGRNLSLVVIDLDDFKTVNDRVGHLGGDAALVDIAERLRSVVRGADVPCRVGGDEFAVILPESEVVDAEQLYQRLHLALEGRPVGRGERVRLSAGIASLQQDDDAESLFQRADAALFRAKRAGKGRALSPDDLGRA